MISFFKNSTNDLKAFEAAVGRGNDRDISFRDPRIDAATATNPFISAGPSEAFYRFNDLATAGSARGRTWPSAGNGLHRMTPV